MSFVKGYPPLFDGVYKGGLVELIDSWEYAEAYQDKDEKDLRVEVEALSDLHRVWGGIRFTPLFFMGEDGMRLSFSWEVVDLAEEGKGKEIAVENVPFLFLRNVPGTEILQEVLTKTDLADGPVGLNDFVWLMSLRRIETDVLDDTQKSWDRRSELLREYASIQEFHQRMPAGEYQVLEMEQRENGVYLKLQNTRHNRAIVVSAEFLVPCNRPSRRRR
jgi:hypothetical protein